MLRPMLDDGQLAARAGKRLVDLLIETQESPREDPQIAAILNDALIWQRPVRAV